MPINGRSYIQFTLLDSATTLLAHLDNTYDILYMVCHGRFETSDPPDTWLYLEDAQGKSDPVPGNQFVTELQRLAEPPNLVLLVSCQSAGQARTGNEGVLAALGPRLIRAGVPAVVAMQDDLRMDTAKAFVPSLLQNLQKTGTIDWAVGEARRAVERQPDFYAPVLFHRLKSGRIWYGDDDIAADQDGINWSALLTHIQNGDGTVLLGSGLLEPYVGSQAELALRLAMRFKYPFSEKERDDLAMVTQYVSAVRTRKIMQQEVLREMALQLLRRHGESIPELLNGLTLQERTRQVAGLEQQLPRMLETVWETRRHSEHEPYTVLAKLPFKAYITTNPDQLLEKALDKKQAFVWRCGRNGPRPGLRKTPPTKEDPLLAYVYGSLSDPDSLVLTEDDYFEYLTNSAGSDTAPVKAMNRVFLESALIFLGFRLHEWDFRIFFRRLKKISGWAQHRNFSHVAVQLDPSSAGGGATTQEVRRFLRNFIESDRIDIFEGSVEQFVSSLSRRFGAVSASA